MKADLPNLLPLMFGLAEFEKYADGFAITEEVLHEQGFGRSPPDFHCLVAEESGALIGLLVYYFVPFTYRTRQNRISSSKSFTLRTDNAAKAWSTS